MIEIAKNHSCSNNSNLNREISNRDFHSRTKFLFVNVRGYIYRMKVFRYLVFTFCCNDYNREIFSLLYNLSSHGKNPRGRKHVRPDASDVRKKFRSRDAMYQKKEKMTIKEKEKEKKSEKRFKLGYFLLSKNLINIQRFLSENYYSGHRGRDSSSRGKKRRGRFPRDVPHVQRTFSYLFFLFSFLYYFHALYN